MDETLMWEVWERLLTDESLNDPTRLLVLSACEGEAELARELSGEAVTRPEPEAPSALTASVELRGGNRAGPD